MAAALRWGGMGLAALFLWCVAASAGLVLILELWEGLGGVPVWAIPFQWFLFAWQYRNHHGVADALLWSGGAATLLAGACLARGAGIGAADGRPLHGASAFATRRQAERRGLLYARTPPGDAIVLGRAGRGPWRRYVCLPGRQHVALYAPTEAGKGVSFVVPNIQNWGGSVVAFSIKRDLVKWAAAERARRGDEVSVFDVTDPHGRTVRWNPLGTVRRDTPDAYDDVQKVMFKLVPETKANNPYWDNAARRIATAVGVVLAETPGQALTVPAIRRAVGRPDFDAQLRGLVAAARAAGRPYPAAAVDAVLGWIANKDTDEARGVRQTILTALALWDVPRIAAATAESDFDLRALRSKRMSVFVCCQQADIDRLRPIYGLLFEQIVALMAREEFGDSPDHRHLVFMPLDEAWALGRVRAVADAAAFIRSSGLRIAYVLQNKKQMVSSLGDEGAKNLFANTGAECLFGGVDQDTAEEVSRRGGNDTVTEVSRSRPRWMAWAAPNRQTENEAARRRALMLPQEVQRLGDDELLVLRPRLGLLKIRRVFWYKDPWFKRMGGEPPPVPRLAVPVERDMAPPPVAPLPTARRTSKHAPASTAISAGSHETPCTAKAPTAATAAASPSSSSARRPAIRSGHAAARSTNSINAKPAARIAVASSAVRHRDHGSARAGLDRGVPTRGGAGPGKRRSRAF